MSDIVLFIRHFVANVNISWMPAQTAFREAFNASKYQRLTEVSKPTATRDLQELRQKGILSSFGGGRSTRYELNF